MVLHFSQDFRQVFFCITCWCFSVFFFLLFLQEEVHSLPSIWMNCRVPIQTFKYLPEHYSRETVSVSFQWSLFFLLLVLLGMGTSCTPSSSSSCWCSYCCWIPFNFYLHSIEWLLRCKNFWLKKEKIKHFSCVC